MGGGGCSLDTNSAAATAPLISSYNDRIRPLLDAVDRLRHLNIMKEGISLPTIVVVGDQSSGKSSVLESLAGISLPRGQGICTRAPLIMRLQSHPDPTPQLQLEYSNRIVPTSEEGVSDAINAATLDIAGDGKGISNTPLTLFVKKEGVPDLTMVDLPGITRVPVHGQPEDIYEQISDIIMQYITPEESIILNVLSATVDFPTCESIRMSQRVDPSGKRTLAVVTKADKAPEGLHEKVTADDVNIGLGYVCVRNRIGDESYEEARKEEERLFRSNPMLSKIDGTMVGVPTLAQKLVQVQAVIIGRCLPEIVRKIDDKLNQNLSELSRIPRSLRTFTEATTAFMRILGDTKESLRKILFRGEFEEFPEDKQMHGTARLAEMVSDYSTELHAKHSNEEDSSSSTNKFLVEEISILEETKGIWLPNFLPHTAFLSLLRNKVEQVAGMPRELVRRICSYVEDVVVRVLVLHSENYPQLQSSTIRAARNLISKMREKLYDNVRELVEKEKLMDYTSNPEYMNTWATLMEQRDKFMGIVNDISEDSVELKGFGRVTVGHLRKHLVLVEQAFDMKMRLAAYWKIVLLRLVDNTAYDVLFRVGKLVNREMEEVVGELMGPGMEDIERMLEESPATAVRRARLGDSVTLLGASKDVISKAMDRIAALGDCLD